MMTRKRGSSPIQPRWCEMPETTLGTRYKVRQGVICSMGHKKVAPSIVNQFYHRTNAIRCWHENSTQSVSYSLRWVDSSFKSSIGRQFLVVTRWGTADMSVMEYIGEE